MHRFIVGVASPHADHQVGGIAHRPVVAPVGGGPGLGGGWTREPQRASLAKGGGAGEVIAQDVGDEVGHALVHHARTGRGLPGLQHPPAIVLHAVNGDGLHPVAAVGKGSVGGRQFQQTDLAAAQRQCQAEAIHVVEGRDAH